MTTKSLVKKPIKKQLTKKADHDIDTKPSEDIFVEMNLLVTLECPKCKVQQVMTLEEYFTKIDYDYRDTHRNLLRCELCTDHPELMFYKVDKLKIMFAGMNWERKQLGVSKEQMRKMMGIYANEVKAIKPKKNPKRITG